MAIDRALPLDDRLVEVLEVDLMGSNHVVERQDFPSLHPTRLIEEADIGWTPGGHRRVQFDNVLIFRDQGRLQIDVRMRGFEGFLERGEKLLFSFEKPEVKRDGFLALC